MPKPRSLSLNKDEINQLPLHSFPGKISLIDKPDQVSQAIRHLYRQKQVGLDTETRPAFQKGQRFPIALIQIAADHQTFLFQVSRIGMSAGLKGLLEDPGITKIVQGADQELVDLARDFDVRARSFFDLLPEAKRLQCSPQGVRGLAAIFLGFRISKSAQRSNWGSRTLSPKQIQYAATDAWVCLKVFQEMEKRKLLRLPLNRVDYQDPVQKQGQRSFDRSPRHRRSSNQSKRSPRIP